MSAIVVCGNRNTTNNNKRSFFEDLPTNNPTTTTTSPSSSSKRLRCLSRFSPPRSTTDHFNPFAYSSLVYHLKTLFPSMDNQLLEKALEECGNDLDSAIKRLTELRLSSADADSEAGIAQLPLQSMTPNGGDVASSDDQSTLNNLPKDGSEWVELLVREMANACNMDDAKARASRVLEFLETSIRTRAGAKAAENFQMENAMLKEQIEALIRENTILKRAVAIQHERQKEYDEQSQELQHLKQLVSQYQEQLRTLEVNNYALTVHLKQAQQSSSIPGRFHPDVF
ncbi:hypothetical protein AQUCO_00400678v1 [Aquilegia coerulea]|uniref:CUE domain-containing protein n=1 Tax=Aquilegia coerulea TaxID=218851 RepID=A0A2G5EW56_AQUCA|nr:hypothetical protein AQUCO_00400678v1 [Aquilegia coerulea]